MSYRGKCRWDWLAFVCIYEENVENFGLGRIMMSGDLDFSRMKNHNLQCVTVTVACGQRSDPFLCYMAVCRTEDEFGSTLSCGGK